MLKEKMRSKIKYLILIVLLIVAGAVYLIKRNGVVEKNETDCISCASEKQASSNFQAEITDSQTFEDKVGFSSVATTNGSAIKYFNWKPENPCSVAQGCYLSNITAKVTFLNAGDPLIVSKKGDTYVQIANSHESNYSDPSQAVFTRYIASSPAMAGGQSTTTNANLFLSPTDGFNQTSDCFSLKLFSQSVNEGEINFATILLSLTYTWAQEEKYETQ